MHHFVTKLKCFFDKHKKGIRIRLSNRFCIVITGGHIYFVYKSSSASIIRIGKYDC